MYLVQSLYAVVCYAIHCFIVQSNFLIVQCFVCHKVNLMSDATTDMLNVNWPVKWSLLCNHEVIRC